MDDEEVGVHEYVSAFRPMKDKDSYDSAEEIVESNARKIAMAAQQTTLTKHRVSLRNKKKRRSEPYLITGEDKKDKKDDQRAPLPCGHVTTEDNREPEEEQVEQVEEQVEEEQVEQVEEEEAHAKAVHGQVASAEAAEEAADEDVNVNDGSHKEGPDDMTGSQQGVVHSGANLHTEDGDVEEDAGGE